MHTKQTSRDTFQANENGSKNNHYPNEKQFIEALNNLYNYAKHRSNSPYIKDFELKNLNAIIKSFTEFFNGYQTLKEKIKNSEKAAIICQLTGLTDQSLATLYQIPTWFLKKELVRVTFEEDYIQHSTNFFALVSRYNSLLSLILLDKSTVIEYATILQLKHSTVNDQIIQGYENILNQLRKQNTHLRYLFYEIESNKPTNESDQPAIKNLIPKIEKIYETDSF